MLTDNEQLVLDTICLRAGGVDIHEAMNPTNLSYTELVQTVYRLIGKGYQITALSAGSDYDPRFQITGYVKRLYLSPYDSKYNDLIKQ